MLKLNKFIDHTLLKPEATLGQIQQLCQEAMEWDFATVCVNPTWVEECSRLLVKSNVKVCTVIGFPLGAGLSSVKAFETQEVINLGASEIDMVINIGALKEKDYNFIEEDIESVVEAAKEHLVKVIFETCLLSDEEIVKACQLSEKAGAHFVKTSTGFSKSGATIEHIKLMRNSVSPNIGVKASGGVRDLETALAMINNGANRIGTSSGISIMQGTQGTSHY
ncbi:MAG: deoxyribose-phosphate aldolase [Bdellovibrio sp. CG12_big_fil_rev_8_21_14_0_65_39_13]|nr:MAG: deoxyribose-phosphate aldolase [Bdellovibrio sp. CG22_combo_CG10-13_8_21_14_all_39_27]PIQ58931.1 MAG: deoxyribose-phosphate aldolase [Bdellovibrio sp. CG12_big_fil_rev_8_21_14_0_65_39_13]PIR36020.1 MAG: deoxyribose-phosphate aldolase [Bdellovibrio sp. CG11_big_fil_rev_8_21_14_0_20_39_38]